MGTKGPPRAVAKYKGLDLCQKCFDAACLGYSVWNKGGRKNFLKAMAKIDLGHEVLTEIVRDTCTFHIINPVRLPKGRDLRESWARTWALILADQLTTLEPREIAGYMGVSRGQIVNALWKNHRPRDEHLDEAIERIQENVPYQLVWC